MDAARFASGLTWAEFVAGARKYQELWAIGLRRAAVPSHLADELAGELKRAGTALNVAVLNEDWCLDAVSTVPAIVRLSELVPGIEVRIFGRDANPDLMDAHLTNRSRGIPLAILYSGDFTELGCWGPRPAPLQEWVRTVGTTLPAGEKYQHIRQWYARDKGVTTLAEVAALVRGAIGECAAERAARSGRSR